MRGRTELPRVDIAYSYAGADGAAIRAHVAAGARAIVSAGLAPGVPTPAANEALIEARVLAMLALTVSDDGNEIPRMFDES